jgi:hypothetical protein
MHLQVNSLVVPRLLLQLAYTRLSIVDQADIRTRINHLNLYTFKKSVPIVIVLILDECERYR